MDILLGIKLLPKIGLCCALEGFVTLSCGVLNFVLLLPMVLDITLACLLGSF